jgi:hypothetical protein
MLNILAGIYISILLDFYFSIYMALLLAYIFCYKPCNKILFKKRPGERTAFMLINTNGGKIVCSFYHTFSLAENNINYFKRN